MTEERGGASKDDSKIMGLFQYLFIYNLSGGDILNIQDILARGGEGGYNNRVTGPTDKLLQAINLQAT